MREQQQHGAFSEGAQLDGTMVDQGGAKPKVAHLRILILIHLQRCDEDLLGDVHRMLIARSRRLSVKI
jgi:hypothetical protein